MKRRIICLAAAMCLMLSGCSWMDGNYLSVQPHREQLSGTQDGVTSAANYQQLRQVMTELVEAGYETAVIHVGEYDREQLPNGMENVINYICNLLPMGAYAVDSISYDIGTIGGEPAVSVSISYIHGRSEIRNVQNVTDTAQAKQILGEVLDQCSDGVVLRVADYVQLDVAQFVEDYAREHPDTVMEVPRVAVGIYPQTGSERIIEVEFAYRTRRESLQQMQTQVQRVFDSAALYVSSNAERSQKYTQLYRFLMERYDYQIDTSITASYSLLCHGVGDSEAFATVYAAMCAQAGLECQIVSGTRAGRAWYWNLIRDESGYAHVDLLQSSEKGQFTRLAGTEMQGYVWDYSAYPEGVG